MTAEVKRDMLKLMLQMRAARGMSLPERLQKKADAQKRPNLPKPVQPKKVPEQKD